MPGDVQRLSTVQRHEFAFVKQPNRQVFHQIDRIAGLPGMMLLLRPPLDIAGPSGHGGQMQGEIGLPCRLRDAHHGQTIQHGLFRPVTQGIDLLGRVRHTQ